MASIINASTTSTSGLVYSADASGVLQLQGNGTTGLTVGNTGNVTVNTNLFVSGAEVEPLILGTAQASTSGTNIDFTGIPNWVKRITVMFNGVSTNGTSYVEIRLGTSSGIVSSGYISMSAYVGTASYGTTASNIIITDGFTIDAGGPSAPSLRYGHMILSLVNPSTNSWVASHTIGHNIPGTGYFPMFGGGSVSLASVLTQLRLTTVNGTDAFDAGSINIMYE